MASSRTIFKKKKGSMKPIYFVKFWFGKIVKKMASSMEPIFFDKFTSAKLNKKHGFIDAAIFFTILSDQNSKKIWLHRWSHIFLEFIICKML